MASWDDRFTDPLKATERAFEQDPETAKLSALLVAWHEVAEDNPRTIAQMRTLASQLGADGEPLYPALVESLEAIAGDNRGNINSRSLGHWIERHAKRRVGGLRFVRRGDSHRAVLWAVYKDLETNQQKLIKTHHTHRQAPINESRDTARGELNEFRRVCSEQNNARGPHASSFAFQTPIPDADEETF